MKILKIRICNINSLRGNWEIDFSDPAYAAGGLFAICGPTGSGKTTVLDAVCLALYGRTPRIDSVTQENEVMTRGCGICESELTFSANGTQYRALFRQWRAGKKSDGKLQSAKVELSRFSSGNWELLETQKKRFDKHIEDITGLNFSQFTRAVMLAQGSFSVFLRAAPDDRAAALERITGTEIYADISRRVHERNAAENAELTRLQTLLDAHEVLSDEELAEKKKELEQAEDNALKTKAERDRLASLKELFSRLHAAEAKASQTAGKHEKLQQRMTELAPEKERLALARKAFDLSPVFNALSQARTADGKAAEELSRLNAQLPPTKEALASAEQQSTEANQNEAQARKALEDLLPRLVQVRKLDADAASAKEKLEDIRNRFKDETQKAQNTAAALKTADERLKELAERKSALTAQTDPESAAAKIAVGIEHVAAAATAAANAFAARQMREKAVGAAKDAYSKTEQAKLQAQETVAPAKAAIEALTQKLAQLQQDRKTAAGGLTLKTIADMVTKSAQKSQLSRDAKTLLKTYNTAQTGLKEDQADLKIRESELASLTARKEDAVKLSAAAAKTLDAVTEKLRMADLVEQFARARSELTEGSPCPLCGAVHHPYAEAAPDKSTVQSEERQAQDALKTARSHEDDITRQVATKEGEVASQKAMLEKHAAECERAGRQFVEVCEKLSVDPEKAEQELDRVIEEAQNENKRLTDKQNELAGFDDEIAKTMQEKTWAENESARALAALERLTPECSEKKAALEATQAEYAQAIQTSQSAHAEFAKRLEGFARPPAEGEDASGIVSALRETAAAYRKACEELQSLEKDTAALEASRKTLQEKAQELTVSLGVLEKDARAIEAQVKEILAARRELFGDKSADDEERAARNTANAAQSAKEKAAGALAQAKTALATLNTALEAAQKRTQETQATLEAEREKWGSARLAAGFDTDEVWQQALIAEDVLLEKEARHATLEKELSLAARDAQTASEALAEIRKTIPQETSEEAVLASLQAAETAYGNANTDKGRLQALLEADAKTRSERSQATERITQQKAVCSTWKRLHDLIGSHDGKKYRRFVQSITFDTLLYHANKALKTISERYILKSEATEPLKLNVTDTYQSGVERSADNLSGGESFIVSLALALGLSRMAGKKMRIESLFLDEGFGTLDPDALDAALNALAALQSEGKMIGIISHVGEIRERIGTIIELTPASGGLSTVSGPGVHKLENVK